VIQNPAATRRPGPGARPWLEGLVAELAPDAGELRRTLLSASGRCAGLNRTSAAATPTDVLSFPGEATPDGTPPGRRRDRGSGRAPAGRPRGTRPSASCARCSCTACSTAWATTTRPTRGRWTASRPDLRERWIPTEPENAARFLTSRAWTSRSGGSLGGSGAPRGRPRSSLRCSRRCIERSRADPPPPLGRGGGGAAAPPLRRSRFASTPSGSCSRCLPSSRRWRCSASLAALGVALGLGWPRRSALGRPRGATGGGGGRGANRACWCPGPRAGPRPADPIYRVLLVPAHSAGDPGGGPVRRLFRPRMPAPPGGGGGGRGLRGGDRGLHRRRHPRGHSRARRRGDALGDRRLRRHRWSGAS
jgi:hypothetical protein